MFEQQQAKLYKDRGDSFSHDVSGQTHPVSIRVDHFYFDHLCRIDAHAWTEYNQISIVWNRSMCDNYSVIACFVNTYDAVLWKLRWGQ